MKKLLFLLLPLSIHAQSTLETDTVRLAEVTVRGYESNRSLLELGASVSLLTAKDLQQRFAGTPTPVPALNVIPGVRMDERSPGSYRLSIRGSQIRSPFGVRNVKIYWNELPLTDAGGSTALNALDVRSLGRIEVIKGPSGSLYGAGTGGTVLLNGLTVPVGERTLEGGALVGSYGLLGHDWTYRSGSEGSVVSINFSHLQADGYRRHSALVRDNLNLAATFTINPKQQLSVLGFYSDLSYQTPGGLTEAQFRADPRQPRPATRTVPGSAEQQAAIYQKTGYLGFSHTYQWSDRIENTTVVYGTLTDFANPFITNYERRADQGVGGRTVTRVRLTADEAALPLRMVAGAEWQHNYTISRNYGNRRGQADTLQTDDDLRAAQSLVFGQMEADLPLGFIATAGLSRNEVRYVFTRNSVVPVTAQTRRFEPVWLPRVALLKRVGENVSVFGSVSTGYSAPTIQEIRPSDLNFNQTLEAERGVNYEIGARGSLANRFRFDLTYYQFRLNRTIVRRSNDSGAEFFVNAGRTSQQGLESLLSWSLIPDTHPFWQQLTVWNSLTLTRYRYENYRQGAVEASGNRVPGVAPLTVAAGLDAETRSGLYAHLTYQFLNPFPLNDANTARSVPARLLNATLGFRKKLGRRWMADVFVSGDNLLDQTYSLGYDLNAFGGRFFNAAPRRNVSGGVRVRAMF